MDRSTNTKGIAGSWLKMIAVVTMLIDHTAATILERLIMQQPAWAPAISANMDTWYSVYIAMRTIGRMAFPIYCFLLVEGFTYTRSRGRYALRLFVFALISEIPFDLALNSGFFAPSYNNVFFTLLIGLLTVMAADRIRTYMDQKRESGDFRAYWAVRTVLMIGVLLLGCVLAELVARCDYGACGVLAIFALYVLKDHRMAGFAAAVLVLGLLSSTLEFAALLMLIPMYFYNGTRGRQMKYFFYAFYPVHLLILSCICYIMGLGL